MEHGVQIRKVLARHQNNRKSWKINKKEVLWKER
jgi:hypothetical protein